MSRSPLRLATAAAAAILAGPAAAQTPMVASTRDFIAAAAQSDHFEVVEGRTALAQSHDPRVLAFAREMIQAHMATSQALQAAAARAGLEAPPKGLDGDQQKMLGALQAQRGVGFDRTYLKQQTLAHQQALVVEQAYAAQGANADIRQVAASAVPAIRRHLATATQLRSEVGGD